MASLTALVVAFVRFRATEISGATFDHPLADGTTNQITFTNAGPWIGHFEIWGGASLAFALSSVALAVVARNGRARD